MRDYAITHQGKTATIALFDRLTAADVPTLQPLLKQAVADGAREIVFDLAGTAILDSTGIGLLIATNNSLASRQGTVRLVNVSADILKLLRSMRLVERLNASAAEGKVTHV